MMRKCRPVLRSVVSVHRLVGRWLHSVWLALLMECKVQRCIRGGESKLMESRKTCHLIRIVVIMTALTIFLVVGGSTPRTPTARASGSPPSPMATMTASSTVAPERLVVNGQYSDERFI